MFQCICNFVIVLKEIERGGKKQEGINLNKQGWLTGKKNGKEREAGKKVKQRKKILLFFQMKKFLSFFFKKKSKRKKKIILQGNV